MQNKSAKYKKTYGEDEMSDIFLSYKREDKETAQKIMEAFIQEGFSVWWDNIIPIGAPFRDDIEVEVKAAGCVVVLWSNKSKKSTNVKTEADVGFNKNILIPILIEDVNPPFEYTRIKAANLVEWDGTSSYHEFQLILESIRNILDRPQVAETEILKPVKNIIENNKRRYPLQI